LDGDVEYARTLLRLYRGKPIGQARVAAWLTKLPQPLARAIIAGRQSIMRRLRRN
jgi:hypothetical protein